MSRKHATFNYVVPIFLGGPIGSYSLGLGSYTCVLESLEAKLWVLESRRCLISNDLRTAIHLYGSCLCTWARCYGGYNSNHGCRGTCHAYRNPLKDLPSDPRWVPLLPCCNGLCYCCNGRYCSLIRMCKHFVKGSCRLGTLCAFAHGRHELS